MKLDVLSDPWITCKLKDGSIQKLGARDVLRCAHEITDAEIPEACTRLDETAVFTFLEMIVYASYRFTTERQKMRLYQQGRFDLEKIDGYLNWCRNNGISFDVFDSENPFLQCSTAYVKEAAMTPKPVGDIDPVYLSGNNNVFYKANNRHLRRKGQTIEWSASMSPEQYAASIMRNQMYRAASGGYTPSGLVNGEPPLVVIVQGSNLFETLLMSAPVQSEELAESDLPMWERKSYKVDVAEELAKDRFGFLNAQMVPTAYLHYGWLDEQNGRVLSVYVSSAYPKPKGQKKEEQPKTESTEKSKGKKKAKDKKIVDKSKPSAYYSDFLKASTTCLKHVNAKDGTIYASKYDLTRQLWRELASADAWLLNGKAQGLEAQRFLEELHTGGLIADNVSYTCKAYGLLLTTQSQKWSAQGVMQCRMPMSILTDASRMRVFAGLTQKIDNARYQLNRCAVQLMTEATENKIGIEEPLAETETITAMLESFDEHEGDRMVGEWLERIGNGDPDIKDFAGRQLEADAMAAFDSLPIYRNSYLTRSKYRAYLAAGLKERDGRAKETGGAGTAEQSEGESVC